jgi:hypothetical protein
MATRFYFSSVTAPNISAPAAEAGWGHSSGTAGPNALRATTTKDGSAMTTMGHAYDSSDHIVNTDALGFVFISDSLTSQSIANNRIKAQFRCDEANVTGNNLFLTLKMYLISSAGAAGSTLMPLTRTSSLEFAQTNPTNRTFNVVMTGGPYSVADGDRIVIEVGAGGLPTSGVGTQGHNFEMSIGSDNATDLPEDETTTAANNPWLSFGTDTLTFRTGSTPFQTRAKPHRFFNRRF